MEFAEFSLTRALLGGALLGMSTTLFMVFNGRVAGVSGLFGQLLLGRDPIWRGAWIGGLIAGGIVVAYVFPAAFGAPVQHSFGLLLLAGVLVGAGTRIGSGCTSGHGICGLSRFSPRSLVATLSFIAAGAAMVVVSRAIGWLP